MSSHREAPEISKDPVADSTDVYAFVSPDKPSTVTLIANYVPLQPPSGGPNFYEFGEDVLYEIHIDTNGNAEPDITYQFRFTTQVGDPNTFLYNTGADHVAVQLRPGTASSSTRSPAWTARASTSSAPDLACPPCNIGPLSTPHYATVLAPACRAHAVGWQLGLRWPARRGLLRRPRLDLRPRQPATDPGTQRLRQGAWADLGGRGELDQVPERALDRAAGGYLEDHRAEPAGHRRLDDARAGGASASGTAAAATGPGAARTRRCRGSATR